MTKLIISHLTGTAGWKDVVENELIEADLNKVALQIMTNDDQAGRVEIRVTDDQDGAWSYFQWSVIRGETFQLEGHCINSSVTGKQV